MGSGRRTASCVKCFLPLQRTGIVSSLYLYIYIYIKVRIISANFLVRPDMWDPSVRWSVYLSFSLPRVASLPSITHLPVCLHRLFRDLPPPAWPTSPVFSDSFLPLPPASTPPRLLLPIFNPFLDLSLSPRSLRGSWRSRSAGALPDPSGLPDPA
jgi:hypothetical protein